MGELRGNQREKKQQQSSLKIIDKNEISCFWNVCSLYRKTLSILWNFFLMDLFFFLSETHCGASQQMMTQNFPARVS